MAKSTLKKRLSYEATRFEEWEDVFVTGIPRRKRDGGDESFLLSMKANERPSEERWSQVSYNVSLRYI